MRKSFLASILLIFVLQTTESVAVDGKRICSNVYEGIKTVLSTPGKGTKNLWAKLWTKKKIERFNFKEFNEFKESFKQNAHQLPAGKTLEENLAFLEVSLQRQDPKITTIGEVLASKDWTRKRRLFQLFDHRNFIGKRKSFRFNTPKSADELDNFYKQFYFLLENRKLSLADIAFDLKNAKLNNSFDNYFNEKVSSQGMKGMFTELEMLKKGKLFDLKKMLRNPKAEAAMTVLFNLQLLRGELVLGYLPRLNLIKLPPALIERAVLNGVGSVKDELFALYGKKYKRQLIYDSFRATVLKISFASYATTSIYDLYQQQKEMEAKVADQSDEMAQAIGEQLDLMVAQQLEENKKLMEKDMGQKIFENWLKEEELRTGAPVDTATQEYKTYKKMFMEN